MQGQNRMPKHLEKSSHFVSKGILADHQRLVRLAVCLGSRKREGSPPWRIATIRTSRDDRCDDVTQHPYPFTMVSGTGATDLIQLLRRLDVSSRNCSM
jgi:hypothetical protein